MPTVVTSDRRIDTMVGVLTGGGNLASNLKFNLAQVNVTPNTYGNTTHYFSYTVDQYGRSSNVVPLAFANANFSGANVANLTVGTLRVLNVANIVNGNLSANVINANVATITLLFSNNVQSNTVGAANGSFTFLSVTNSSFANLNSNNLNVNVANITTAYIQSANLGSPTIVNRITRNGKWVSPYILAGADHNCANDGVTDASINMANAIAEANATGRELYFEPGFYNANCATFIPISTSGVHIKGAGRNSTVIRNTHTSGNTFTFTGQLGMVSDLTFWPLKMRSTGAEIGFDGAYQPIVERVLFEYHRQAIDIFNTATPLIRDCTALYCYGTENIKLHGNSSIGSHGAYIKDTIFNNAWVLAPDLLYSAWGYGKAFTTGQHTYVDGWILQCLSNGTTANSGTVTIPSSDSYSWSTIFGTFNHGTASFRVIQSASLTHVLQENYGHSLSMRTVTCLNGAYGYRMADTANTGTSYPMWMDAVQLVSDHAYFAGISATGGADISIGTGTWLGSTLKGSAIQTLQNFKGPFKMIQGRIMGNANYGMNHSVGNSFHVAYNVFAANGFDAFGSFNDVYIAPNIGDFDYSHNRFGSENGAGVNWEAYGLYLDTGTSNNYVIAFNRSKDVTQTCVFDGGSGASKYVYNNFDV